jgi:hypothetical protein
MMTLCTRCVVAESWVGADGLCQQCLHDHEDEAQAARVLSAALGNLRPAQVALLFDEYADDEIRTLLRARWRHLETR